MVNCVSEDDFVLIGCMLAGATLVVLAVELAFRFLLPAPKFLVGGDVPSEYVVDEVLGFKPVFGSSAYNH